jgi:L-2,4-diaminobutyrate decarboxylase
MSLKVYAALALYGGRVLGEHVARTFDLAERLAARVAATPELELAVAPECNIVCFRVRSAGDPDALQRRERRRILEEGSFYLTETHLPSGVFLRVSLMNPRTTDEDLEQLLERIRALALDAASL